MAPTPPSDRPLGPLSRDVLAVLIDETEARAGFSRARAIEILRRATAADEDRLWETEDYDQLDAEIDEVLDSLLNRGYLDSARESRPSREGRVFRHSLSEPRTEQGGSESRQLW